MIKNAKIYGKFYSPEKILSYNRPWMFVIGSRSIGKSTSLGMYFIKDYLENANKFIYVRRTEDEVRKTCKSFFDNPVQILKNFGYEIFDFKYDKRDYYIKRKEGGDWEKCGTTIPLSLEQKYKSSNYSEYNNILYDEFISRNNHYLGSKANIEYEYDCCLSLYQTVDRDINNSFQNKTKFFFSANNASYFNPIFISLRITDYLRTDTKFLAPKSELWVVEQINEVEATKEIKNSFAYRLSSNKNKDYAYNNIALDETTVFIEKSNAVKYPLMNLIYNKTKFGVYYLKNENKIYVCNKTNTLPPIALTLSDQDAINYNLVQKFTDYSPMIKLRNFFMQGNVIFENSKLKYIITNYLKLTS